MHTRRLATLLFIISAGLLSCQPTQPVVYMPQPAASEEPAEISPDAAAEEVYREEIRQQLAVADLLYLGLRALAEDRLMTPPENSALSIFNRVLIMQPGNPVAEQGISDIAARYLQLADASSRQGQFDNARLYLQRAEIVYPGHERIAAARDVMEFERRRTHSVHRIDGRDLARRSDTLTQQLQGIAQQVREMEAFVMITAPNDAHGRWIYAQMQAGVTGYRVRGDIEIGEQASVRVVLAQPGS